MAVYTTIDDAGIFFNLVLYTGTGTTHTITGVGFQPDFVWAKSRSSGQDPRAIDAVRGGDKVLYPSLNNAAATDSELITSFNSDGYVMGTSGTNANDNTVTYVSWNWKMGTTSGLSGGTITPSAYSISATAGQSVLAYTGNNTSGATIPHGLGVTPGLIICKRRDGADNWWVHVESLTGPQYMVLNSTGAVASATAVFNDTLPGATLFTIGNDAGINASGGTYIAYCFAPVQGYSKFGKYMGNGNADGTFVYTGFRPAFVMGKIQDGTDSWHMWDDKRDVDNPVERRLEANSSGAEHTTIDWLDFVSNGFKHRYGGGGNNNSGSTYLYMAFADSPLVNSNGVPNNAH